MRLGQVAITAYVSETCSRTDVVVGTEGIGAGDTFFISNPDRDFPDRQQLPFATIVTKDYGDFDNASNLNREGVFRHNAGIGRETFRSLFGDGGTYDFSVLDRLMPRTVYGRQSWVCVLNPSTETLECPANGNMSPINFCLTHHYATVLRGLPSATALLSFFTDIAAMAAFSASIISIS